MITDLGFIVYWVSAALNLIPSAWLYEDGDNPILVAWNWSFAPVDLVASVLGLTSLALARQSVGSWSLVAMLSVALTFCAGLLAVSFWALRGEFDPVWWLPNLYLVVWPLFAVAQIFRIRNV